MIVTVTLNPALDLTIALERLAVGAVNRARRAELRPAGKGVNVAAMLAVLGEPVAAGGLLPEADADAFARFLGGLGVGDAFHRVPGHVRINVKLVEDADGNVTDVNPPGPPAPADALAGVAARIAALDPAPGIAVLSGSLPPGLPASAWADLAAAQRAAGRLVLLDSSGKALETALAGGADVIKPNRDELAALLGRPLPDRASLVEAARALRAQGIGRVVVSAGGEGALFALPDATLWAVPPKVPLTTTVGAGDAMVAGLVAALARGLSAEDTARLATACGAAAVSRPPEGLPDRATIERLAAAVRIEAA
ncbi:1-phosphofructokinase [Roseomonas sp. OT10]|uniref:1-phosphofructokinase n=1 Tax=Roseomonas cutis TaxID=2897332 RepID=UPI001E47D0BE|nr:1-phosphofructokinase [Roseomonas sp. OT10]UFN51204.1 1-phosphofructokinase [Roseomonas sp. OT10]